MKKTAFVLLTTTAMLLSSVNAFAVDVLVNNELIDTEALIVEGRTLVPVRGVFDKLGYEVVWNQRTKTATLTSAKQVISVTNGCSYITVNNSTQINLDVPGQIINSRFYLPLRSISEAIGADVNWNSATKVVTINYSDPETDSESIYRDPVKLQVESINAETAASNLSFSTQRNIRHTDNKSYYLADYSGADYAIVNVSDKIYIQPYSSDGKPQNPVILPLNLPLFGGLHYDGSNFYVITGQNISAASGDSSAYRIDKYNSSGKKLLNANITGYDANVILPFVSGGVDIAVNGDLITFTDSAMRNSAITPMHRQASIVVTFNSKNLNILNISAINATHTKSTTPNTNLPTFVEYGHENYTAICAINGTREGGITLAATEYANLEKATTTTILDFYGTDENTTTKANLGGFTYSSSDYIVAGYSVKQDSSFASNNAKNVFIATVPKTQLNNSMVNLKWITSYTNSDNVSIDAMKVVKIDSSRSVVLWQETKAGVSTTKYVFLNSDGSLNGSIKSNSSLTLSTCDPVVDGTNLVWYSVDSTGSEIKLNSISIN